MMISKRMSPYLSWILVLGFVSSSEGQNFTTIPRNVTISTGGSATFQCGVSKPFPQYLGTFSFSVQSTGMNYSQICPGRPTNYPVQSLNGQCMEKNTEIIATWDIANAATSINGTVFKCHLDGVSDISAYLWVSGSSSYYAMLFGCVMGGFFGILIVFGVSYVFLKRSERLQNCFIGRAEDDNMTVVESSKGY